jgi:hypothetical protein
MDAAERNPMTDSEIIKQVLEKVWPTKVDKAGATAVDTIVSSADNGDEAVFDESRIGKHFDLMLTIKFLIEAATLLKLIIQIYKELPPKSPPKDVVQKVSASPQFAGLKIKEVKDSLQALVEQVKSYF